MNDIILTERSNLIAIADATRNKTGLTNDMNLGDIIEAINSIPEASSGGIDTSDATVTASDILNGKIAYGANGKVTGTIPSQAAKTITPKDSSQTAISAGTYASGAVTVAGDSNLTAANIKKGVSIFGVSGSYEASSSGGIDTSDATATATDIVSGQTAYVNGKKITGTIPSQAAKTITPKATSQTAIAAGTYASGAVTVAGDADLVATNIKKGVSIFGVDGSYEATGGIDTSDATATSADIATGKTAYVNGEKVTGSMVVQSYYVSNVAPSSTLGNDGDLCLVRAGE